jgi:hypothetical protein
MRLTAPRGYACRNEEACKNIPPPEGEQSGRPAPCRGNISLYLVR